jgi:hypothetical protein
MDSDKMAMLRMRADPGLISVDRLVMWRTRLACKVLEPVALPDWKRQEQVSAVQLAIKLLVRSGISDPVLISKRITEVRD